MLQQQGALARKLVPAWRQLGPAAAAGLHRSSAALQEVALQTAPERMGEAAEAVKEVMGEGSEVAAPPEPLPPAQLNFSDPQAAFKVRLWDTVGLGFANISLCDLCDGSRDQWQPCMHCLADVHTLSCPASAPQQIRARHALAASLPDRPSPRWTSCARCWSSPAARYGR
jgi:hypothetical protein